MLGLGSHCEAAWRPKQSRCVLLETGELEVGMGVDEAWKEDRRAQVFELGTGRSGNIGVGTDSGDAPVGADQDRGVLNWRSVNRKGPLGPEAERSEERRVGKEGRQQVVPASETTKRTWT